jgi:hypothetical protein
MILFFDLMSKLKMQISKNGCADNEGVLSDKIEHQNPQKLLLKYILRKIFIRR